MANYNKTTWQSGDLITATAMNNIENAIEALSESNMAYDFTDDGNGNITITESNREDETINPTIIADNYSPSATYAIGDYCLVDNILYRCNTAITTAEAWTPAHWTSIKLANDVKVTGDKIADLKSAFDEYDQLNRIPIDAEWTKAALNADGTLNTSATWRLTTTNILTYSRRLFVFIDSGFQAQIAIYQAGGTFIGRAGITDGYTIAPGTYFRLSIYKSPEAITDNSTFFYHHININAETLGQKILFDVTPSDYSSKLANINGNVIFTAANNAWTDAPFTNGTNSSAGIFTNSRYSANYNYQTYTLISAAINVWARITGRDGTVFRDWEQINGVRPTKILALGDSICSGYRNAGKGFVGDLGLPYKNIGVSGASISNVVTSVTNIPDQLTGENSYEPDIIIADGGFNDYTHAATLGTVPTTPAHNDTEAAALDRTTVMGAAGYLFYQMIKLHPKAQRFFVIVHKMYNAANDMYYPTYQNAATQQYTMNDLHDALVAICHLYNVKVIDIYNDGIINTLFSAYVSDTAYSDDNSVTYTDYVDSDGIHPLDYGYREGYVPLIRQAIGIGTVKTT